MSRKLDNFPRFWAMIIVIGTIVAGTIVTLGYIGGQVERRVKVHNGASLSHVAHSKRARERYVTRRELPKLIRAQIRRTVSPRLERIDQQQRQQWRVIREVLGGDRAAARRALPSVPSAPGVPP